MIACGVSRIVTRRAGSMTERKKRQKRGTLAEQAGKA
jgi:hypothetical protein